MLPTPPGIFDPEQSPSFIRSSLIGSPTMKRYNEVDSDTDKYDSGSDAVTYDSDIDEVGSDYDEVDEDIDEYKDVDGILKRLEHANARLLLQQCTYDDHHLECNNFRDYYPGNSLLCLATAFLPQENPKEISRVLLVFPVCYFRRFEDVEQHCPLESSAKIWEWLTFDPHRGSTRISLKRIKNSNDVFECISDYIYYSDLNTSLIMQCDETILDIDTIAEDESKIIQKYFEFDLKGGDVRYRAMNPSFYDKYIDSHTKKMDKLRKSDSRRLLWLENNQCGLKNLCRVIKSTRENRKILQSLTIEKEQLTRELIRTTQIFNDSQVKINKLKEQLECVQKEQDNYVNR
jgi:hypothetical protein